MINCSASMKHTRNVKLNVYRVFTLCSRTVSVKLACRYLHVGLVGRMRNSGLMHTLFRAHEYGNVDIHGIHQDQVWVTKHCPLYQGMKITDMTG